MVIGGNKPRTQARREVRSERMVAICIVFFGLLIEGCGVPDVYRSAPLRLTSLVVGIAWPDPFSRLFSS